MSYASIIETNMGKMIVPDYDLSQTGALISTHYPNGWDEILDVATHLIARKMTGMFLDVGACIGTWTMFFARQPFITEVHAFEPQNALCNCIAGSAALNGLTNVTCHPDAVGFDGFTRVPQFDYNKPMEFGSVNLGATQEEPLSQERRPDTQQVCRVITLDDFTQIHRAKVALVKIDVEGMESNVLCTGTDMIAENRPILFVEFIKSDKERLRGLMEEMGYTVTECFSDFLGIPKP